MNSFIENESIINYKINNSNITVKKAITEEMNISGRLFRKLIKSKSIYVNGKSINKKQELLKNDVVTIFMEDEKDPNKPNDIPLDIIYEDFDILIINKPPNIVVHPTKSHAEGTIVNGVLKYFIEKGIKKKVRLVNRLDMDTSGALVIAKNPFGHQQMAYQFENNIVKKKYIAVVKGKMNKSSGLIDKPILKDNNSIKYSVNKIGKNAITKYNVLKTLDDASVLDVEIKTGRTHQIRVHLEYLGNPIIGDSLYGKSTSLIQRQALHSHYLSFMQPRTGKIMTIEAKLPEDMKRLINSLS